MNLIKYLEIDESQVHPDARRSLLLAEKIWTQNGSPLERWELVRVLEEILRRCIASGIWYAPMLLQRKKAIERDSWRPRPRDAMRSATPPKLYNAAPLVAEAIRLPAAPTAAEPRVSLPKRCACRAARSSRLPRLSRNRAEGTCGRISRHLFSLQCLGEGFSAGPWAARLASAPRVTDSAPRGAAL